MINLQVKYFPGDFATNMMVLTGSDIPATLLAGYLVNHYKPKTIFVMFFSLQSAAGMTILLFISSSNPGWMFPALVACARVGVVGAFTAVWVLHPRMFPTLFAATSMGIANFVSRGMVIMAPIVAEIAYPTPIVVFTIMTILAGFSSTFLLDQSSSVPSSKEDKTAKYKAEAIINGPIM